MTCQHGQRTMTSSSDISDYRIECGSQSALTCAPDRTKLKCTQPRTSPKLSSGEEYGWWFLVPKVIKLYNIPTHYQNPFWWVFPSTLVFNKKGWQYILLLLLLLLLLSQEVMSDSLWPHELQHARPPCPSPTPGVYPNPCPLSRWCHPVISSSVVPFSSHLQSFPAPGSFQMSQLFSSGGQSIGVSASTSVLPMNTQDWSPLGWTGWISLQSKGLSRVFSNTTVQKHQYFGTQLSL